MGLRAQTDDAPPDSRRDQLAAKRRKFAGDTHAQSGLTPITTIFAAVVIFVMLVLVVTSVNQPNIDAQLECESDPTNHTDQECDALEDAQDTVFLVLTIAGIAVAIFVIFMVVKIIKD